MAHDFPIIKLLELEGSIKATVNILVKAVIDLIQDDPHQWSARPCSTCQTISTLTERPFGCIKYRIDKEK